MGGAPALRAALGLALSLGPAAAGGASPANPPEIDYMLQCRGCHLADGAGAPGRVPDLRDRIGLFLTVPGGREFLVRVPGASQSPLDDARLAAVLNWMIRAFGPAEVAADFAPYAADEVRRYRVRPLIDVDARRAALLERMTSPRPAPPH